MVTLLLSRVLHESDVQGLTLLPNATRRHTEQPCRMNDIVPRLRQELCVRTSFAERKRTDDIHLYLVLLDEFHHYLLTFFFAVALTRISPDPSSPIMSVS